MKRSLSILDNMEILSFNGKVNKFPDHYHESFCISIIEEGTEIIKMGNKKLYTTKGNVSISNPLEVHSNPLFDENTSHKFKTIYLSPDLVNNIIGQKQIGFNNFQESSNSVGELINKICCDAKNDNTEEIEEDLKTILLSLNINNKYEPNNFDQVKGKWLDLLNYIDLNISKRITVQTLSKIIHIESTYFIKQFKLKFGLTPINYVLMKKIYAAKNEIVKDIPISSIAYAYGFTDLPHFSNTFKRFIGISPLEYKKMKT